MASFSDLEPYDEARSLGLREARKLIRGRGGKPANLESVRLWVTEAHGCRPFGDNGPKLILRATKINGEWRTMPGWIAAFERERAEAGQRASQVMPERSPRSRHAAHRRAEEALKKMGVIQ